MNTYLINPELPPGALVAKDNDIYTNDGYFIAEVSGFVLFKYEAEVYAKRLVDCFNSMEGIENPKEFMEKIKTIPYPIKCKDCGVEHTGVVDQLYCPECLEK